MVIAVAYAIVISGYVERLGEDRAARRRCWTPRRCCHRASEPPRPRSARRSSRCGSSVRTGVFAVLSVAVAFALCALPLPALLVRLPLEGGGRRAELAWLPLSRVRLQPALSFLRWWSCSASEARRASRSRPMTASSSPEPDQPGLRLIQSRIGGGLRSGRAAGRHAWRSAARKACAPDALRRQLAEVPSPRARRSSTCCARRTRGSTSAMPTR
jgi:hypothetical protein